MDKSFLSNPFTLTRKKYDNQCLLDNCSKLRHSYFYYDEDTLFATYTTEDMDVYLIGYILDIRNAQQTKETIIQLLGNKYSRSLTDFYNELQFMNGRYVLIFDDSNDTIVYSDATVMRPLFYWNNEIISSHEIIIRETLKDELDIHLERHQLQMNSFLDYSNTEEVYKFNPNLCFSFKKQKFIRFYPMDKYKNQSIEEVIKNTENYFSPQVEWLDRHFKIIYQSLTGGFDAKLSLAINKPIFNKLRLFTYMYKFNEDDEYDALSQHKKIYYKDQYIVDGLVYNFNLNHSYFYFGDYKMPKEYQKTMSTHVTSHHSYILSYLTYKEFEKNSIHVKSTLYELAKQPYSTYAEMKTDDALILKAFKHWAPKEIRENSELLKEMYHSYFRRNRLQEVINKGFNLPMVIYWEYRMGNWHSNITQETDTVMETFIFINSRYMIDQLLTLKLQDKKEKYYLTELVKKFWPALNYFVSNSFDTLENVNQD